VAIARSFLATRPEVARPELARCLRDLAQTLTELGRHDEAEAAAREALELVAETLVVQGRKDEAQAAPRVTLDSAGQALDPGRRAPGRRGRPTARQEVAWTR
jgi:hypothetical protein